MRDPLEGGLLPDLPRQVDHRRSIRLRDTLLWSPVDERLWHHEPNHHYEGDCGYDLFTSENTACEPFQFTNIPTNIRVALPEGVWCMLVGRSSTFKRGLITIPGMIDNGYTGPLFASVYNTTNAVIQIDQGERLIQLIMFNLIAKRLAQLKQSDFDDRFADSERGERGFGSTGR